MGDDLELRVLLQLRIHVRPAQLPRQHAIGHVSTPKVTSIAACDDVSTAQVTSAAACDDVSTPQVMSAHHR